MKNINEHWIKEFMYSAVWRGEISSCFIGENPDAVYVSALDEAIRDIMLGCEPLRVCSSCTLVNKKLADGSPPGHYSERFRTYLIPGVRYEGKPAYLFKVPNGSYYVVCVALSHFGDIEGLIEEFGEGNFYKSIQEIGDDFYPHDGFYLAEPTVTKVELYEVDMEEDWIESDDDCLIRFIHDPRRESWVEYRL